MNSAVHQAVTGHFLTRVPMDNYRGGEKKNQYTLQREKTSVMHHKVPFTLSSSTRTSCLAVTALSAGEPTSVSHCRSADDKAH